LAVGDQGFVALTNLALSVLVTHVGGVAALGKFAIVTTTILLMLGLERLLVCDPWLASRTASRSPNGELRWLVVLSAAASFVVVLVVARVVSDGDPVWLLAAPVAALFIAQDFGRYTAFRVEHSQRAFFSDGAILLVGSLTLVGSTLAGRPVTMGSVFAAWTMGLVGGLVVSGSAFGPLKVGGSRTWWTTFCRSLAIKLGLDTAAYLTAVNGSIYFLAYLGAQEDVGIVRLVQTVYSPVALLTTGITMWLVPVLAHRPPAAAAMLRNKVTVWLTIGSVPLLVVALALGPWLIRVVFGIDEAPSRGLLVLGGVSPLLLAVAAPWIAAARVSGHYLPIAWSRAAAAVVTLVGMLVVPSLRGAAGYLGLLALQSLMVGVAAVVIGLRPSRSTRVAQRSL
jgi:O-antigen/teichoic acid export membrane protein